MALATKCPHCNTIFRVAADQLKLRGGIVRCGSCHDVFDGNAALLDVSAIVAPKALASAPAAPVVEAFLIPSVDFDTSYDPFGILPARAQIHPAAASLLVPQLDDKLELPPGVVPPAVSSNAPKALELPLELALASPVERPPELPVELAVELPIEPPVELPVAPSVELAIEAPVESPIELPLELPVELAVEVPIEPAAEFHSELPAEFRAEPPLFVELPVEAPAEQVMEPPLESPSELAADSFVEFPIEAPLEPFLDPHAQLPVEQPTEPRLESSAKLPVSLLVELPLEAPVDLASELLVELPVELPIDLSTELLVELPVDPFFEVHEPVHNAGAEKLAQTAAPFSEPADPQAFEPSEPEHFEPAPSHDFEPIPPHDFEPSEPHDFEPSEPQHADTFEALEIEPSEAPHVETPEPPGGKREPSFAALLTNHDEHILAIAAPAYELPETAAPTRAAEVKADDIDEPGFVKQVRRRERSGKAMRIAMGLGSAALLITLLGQGVTTFRNQLAARLPQIKPALVSVCAMLDCRVELPAQIEAIAIEQGELQSLSEYSFSYASVLHNQSGIVQAWPDIELILNDAFDKPVLRRVITPREYLPATTDVSKGFATHSEQAVKLYFELAQLKASGYHIAVFYP